MNIANRRALLKYFLPIVQALPPDAPLQVVPDVPMNFAQVANKMLGDKQGSLNNPDNATLYEELEQYEERSIRPAASHPNWNTKELPPDLLRKALSQHAKFSIKSSVAVQQALARLYAVAWFGRGTDSVEAKRQLETLLPTGKTNPITKWVPELADKFREMRRWIRESDKLMMVDFPREIDRVKKLAELYDETTGVISAAIRKAEAPFLAERLSEILGIPAESVKKALSRPRAKR